jgi:hypothetical protein
MLKLKARSRRVQSLRATLYKPPGINDVLVHVIKRQP